MTWLEGPRAQRLAGALLLALAISFLATLTSGSGVETASGRLGGDYPAFYAAGRIAADDGLEHVNDLDHLEAAQADLYPEDDEGFLTWVYPPHVALLYRPLSALPYRPSYAIHTALMVAAFVAAVLLARPLLPWLRRAPVPAIAAGLTFFPMFRGIGSGQNTALSLLLLVAAWRASAADRDGWAGAFIGLLLFKPQFAGLAGLGWLAAGRWRIVPTAVATAVATWGLTAAFAGAGWVSRYLDDLDAYRATEHVNADNHVSLSEAADAAFGVPTVGWGVAAVVLVLVLRRFWVDRGGDLAAGIAALSPALLLCAAHAVFYDVGLVLITAAIAVQAGALAPVAVLWLLGLVDPLKESLGWNPNVLVLLAWVALGLRLTSSSRALRAPQRRPVGDPR